MVESWAVILRWTVEEKLQISVNWGENRYLENIHPGRAFGEQGLELLILHRTMSLKNVN